MKANQLVLRCYAEKDDGSWFAICLDLNLYARGDTFEEAKVKLGNLISGYLKDAVTKDADYFSDLVPRKAPLGFWVRYFCIWCLVRLHQATLARRFILPLPLVPA